MIEVTIKPKTKSDQEARHAIQRLSDEDPTFTVKADEETGQTIIAGMGELHLEILVDRMKREFRVEATVGKPQVATARRSATRSRSTATPTRSRPVGRASSPRCSSPSSPASTQTGQGAGYEFVSNVSGGRIPREYIPSVDQGAQDAMEFGVLAGCPWST